MSRKIDLAKPEKWSQDEKDYLYDRGRLPESMRSEYENQRFINGLLPPELHPTPVKIDKALHEMSKTELIEEADKRGLKHAKNVSYEKILELLEEDDDDELLEDDEEDEEEDEK